MERGTIKTIVEDRGFGFIRPRDGSPDVFFHVNEIGDDLVFSAQLCELPVVYNVIESPKGLRAIGLRIER